MLKVENLTVKVGSFLLRDITFEVKKGGYFTLIGPSGSGKSTLLETIAGFHQPIKGRILLEGEDITHLPPEERKISIVYQDYLLFKHLNAFENIAFGLRKFIKDKTTLRREVERIASLVGVEHLLNKSVDRLSGGEKQRVAIARAIVVKPRVLLLDEPFSALDNLNKVKLRKLIRTIARKENITVVHVTHDFADIPYLPLEEEPSNLYTVGVMTDGQLLETGNFEKIFFHPDTEKVARFVGLNILQGKVLSYNLRNNVLTVNLEGQILETLYKGEGIPQEGKTVQVLFRPETVKVEIIKHNRALIKGETASVDFENSPAEGLKMKGITAKVKDIFTENLTLRAICHPITPGGKENDNSFQISIPYGTPLSQIIKVYPLKLYSKNLK